MTNAPSAITGAAPLDVKARRRPFGLLAIIVIQVLMMVGSFLLLLLAFVTFVFASRMIVVDGIDPAAFKWDLSAADILMMVLTFVVNGVCASWVVAAPTLGLVLHDAAARRLYDQRPLQLLHEQPP